MTSTKKVLHPSWRSHYRAVLAAAVLGYMTFIFSPDLEISFEISMSFLWFIPLIILANAAIKIYDLSYYMDSDGVTSVKGVLSLFRHKSSIRYEDIRSLEVTQTIMGRILGFGTVEIGTAASAGIEITLEGVSEPLNLLKQIENCRDLQEQPAVERPLAANSRLEDG